MKSWVITGGIATGKSSVSRIFGELSGDSIVCFSCDEEAGRLWEQPMVQEEIRSRLGESVLNDGGGLDRGLVRQLVFSDLEAKKALEEIMHPRILAALEMHRKRAEAGKAKVFLAEVPLYYEIQASIMADTVIVVAASRTVQVTRLLVRRNLDATTAENLLKAQLPLDVKVNKANLVVWNDGSEAMLKAQASTIIRAYLEI